MQTFYKITLPDEEYCLKRDLTFEQMGIPPWTYWTSPKDFCWN